MQQPKFLLLDAATRGAWAAEPITAMFVEYLALKGDGANYECAHLLRQGETSKAIAAAGAASCYESLIGDIQRPDPTPAAQEETFVDPVHRFEGKSQEGTEDVGSE